jgi:hypothetical protein
MFGRRSNGDSSTAIDDFWRWWSQTRDRVNAAISDGTVGEMAGEINERVATIHEKLQWELTPGRTSRHALVVAPGGNAALRSTVTRWLAAAPPADAVFEYFGSRQPDDRVFTSRISMDGQELDLDGIRFAFAPTESGHAVDVSVYHPRFADMLEPARVQISFLTLDWALGEEQVELWVGRVETQIQASANLVTPAELRAAVSEVAAKHAEPVYAMLQGRTGKGRPLMAVVQVPLKPARFPRYDTHVAVILDYPAQDNGYPTDEALTRLREVEDGIVDSIGEDGSVLAHETCDGIRTLHIYVDGGTSAAETVASVARSGPLPVRVQAAYDPKLDGVSHLRV